MSRNPRIAASVAKLSVAAVALLAGVLVAGTPALAQFPPPPPELNRIPAPLPPPEPPPIINGPLGQAPSPGVYQPGRLTTHSDRVTRCIDQGAGSGLTGRRLDAYTRRCANAH
jgi:hypothetical protein